MRDAPNDFFGLWDQYFSYAVALGVAARFLRTVKRVAQERSIDESVMLHRAAWIATSSSRLTSLAQVSAAASSLSSALSAVGASASSGGSVGGGGGGGGGGVAGAVNRCPLHPIR